MVMAWALRALASWPTVIHWSASGSYLNTCLIFFTSWSTPPTILHAYNQSISRYLDTWHQEVSIGNRNSTNMDSCTWQTRYCRPSGPTILLQNLRGSHGMIMVMDRWWPARDNIKLSFQKLHGIINNFNTSHDHKLTVSRSVVVNFPQAWVQRPLMREGREVVCPCTLTLVTVE